jgi:hypothetical protein
MSHILADLLDDVVTSYDQTKTTIQGRVKQDVVNSNDVLGPPLTAFTDVFTDSGVALSGVFAISPNITADVVRIFILGAEAAGVTPLLLYNHNLLTNSYTYVGRVNFQTADTAATTTTFRGLKVNDPGTSDWDIFVITTGSVLINGGAYRLNNLALSDFVPIGFPTISFATGNDQKAVYFMQDPADVGSAHIMTASAGAAIDTSGSMLYVHNGVAATHQYWVFDYAPTPTYVTNAVTGTAATDIIADAGHAFVNNDPVTFTALTGGAGLTVGTTYFVVGSVAGVSYQLSATSGGAAINFTTDITAGTIGRAFGTSTNNFLHKTGNLPALTGTLLLNNSERHATPAHGTNSGFLCVAFGTSTALYLGRLSELTSGAVTWPSLATSNLLGSTNEVTTPTAAFIGWSDPWDRFVYNTNVSSFYFKQLVNNSIDLKAGFLNTTYYEGTIPEVVDFGATTVNGLDARHGYLYFTSTATGQRVLFSQDVYSNDFFDYSYIVTKVLDSEFLNLHSIATIEELFDFTSPMVFYYRTSGFGSISGGWTQISVASDLSSISAGTQIQFKIAFNPAEDAGTNPSQIREFVVVTTSRFAISENWEFNYDDSTDGTPSRVSFRLKNAYETSVPTLYFRAYDLSDVLVANHNTSADASFFEYSTDSGANWNSLGTIPNTVGTLIRYNFSTPPGVDVRPSIREA